MTPRSLSSSGKILLIAGGCLAVSAVVVYSIFNPAECWWMPKCPVHLLTGHQCPGCGTQRALFLLLHGDFAQAFKANALLFLLAPYLLTAGIAELYRSRLPRLFKALMHPFSVLMILILIVIWTIMRNIFYL